MSGPKDYINRNLNIWAINAVYIQYNLIVYFVSCFLLNFRGNYFQLCFQHTVQFPGYASVGSDAISFLII